MISAFGVDHGEIAKATTTKQRVGQGIGAAGAVSYVGGVHQGIAGSRTLKTGQKMGEAHNADIARLHDTLHSSNEWKTVHAQHMANGANHRQASELADRDFNRSSVGRDLSRRAANSARNAEGTMKMGMKMRGRGSVMRLAGLSAGIAGASLATENRKKRGKTS